MTAGAREARSAGSARRAAWLVASAVILGAVILVVVIVAFVAWQSSDDGASSSSGGSSFVSDSGAASAPYGGYTLGSLRIGDTTLTVVVADDDAERVQGLRGRSDASPYEGMLFVFPQGTRAAFTMAGVPGPLDIGFYDNSGKNVGKLLMQPCPNGTDATCPIYQIDEPFRYALETAGGRLPAGSLSRP